MMMARMRNPHLILWVTFFLAVFVSSPAHTAMIPSKGINPNAQSAKDLDSIQRALENKLVIEKLSDYGLTPDEVQSKLKDMSPAQIHLLAQASNDVLAGGSDGIGFVIGVLVIVILVIVILKLLGKDVVLKMACLDASAHGGHPALG